MRCELSDTVSRDGVLLQRWWYTRFTLDDRTARNLVVGIFQVTDTGAGAGIETDG